MMMPDAKTMREYSATGVLILQILIVPVLGWTAVAVSHLSGQVALLRSHVSDIRQGGVYTPEQAMRAHDRIHTTLRDHEVRLRDIERAGASRTSQDNASRQPVGR